MLTQIHPVDGYFRFAVDNGAVTLHRHWPAGLQAISDLLPRRISSGGPVGINLSHARQVSRA